MTPREKILRDGLEIISNGWVVGDWIDNGVPVKIKTTLSKHGMKRWAKEYLKQADAVKDRPGNTHKDDCAIYRKSGDAVITDDDCDCFLGAKDRPSEEDRMSQGDIKHLEKVTADLRNERKGEDITLRRANHEEWLILMVKKLGGIE